MKSKLLCLIILCAAIGCGRNESLVAGNWKYQQGHRFADSLDFSENTIVRNDTVFKDDVPYAKFVKVKMGFLGFPAKLYLSDLESNEMGVYVIE